MHARIAMVVAALCIASAVAAQERSVSTCVAEAQPAMRACFERALRREARADAVTAIELVVGPDGHVRGARFEPPPPPSLDACLRTAIDRITWPADSSGPVALRIPLTSDAAR